MTTIIHISEDGIVHSFPASGLAHWGGADNCGNDYDSDDD